VTFPEQAEPESLSSPPPRIARIAVTKLFGVLDHDVVLKREQGVTIVHGINGVGKTKLLELTAALTQGHIWGLLEVSFEQLRLDFDDGTAIEVRREAAVDDGNVARHAMKKRGKHLRPSKANITIRRIRIDTAEILATWTGPLEENVRELQRRGGLPPWVEPFRDNMWLDTRTDRLLTANDLATFYGIATSRLERVLLPAEKRLEFVPCPPAHLIETQRLLRIGGRKVETRGPEHEAGSLVMTVHELATELKRNISVVQGEFFRTTQALDRTLTERVLQATPNDESLGEKLRSRLEALNTHRERLERVGLLDAGTFGPTLAPADAGALRGDRALMIAVHTEDAEEKFKVLDPLATRLELLLNGINEKLAYPKKLVLDRQQELTVQRHGESIALDQLSSGEQHELVLLYDLAFRVRPHTLVLIDEPELSLHPVWQQQFLEDILKIAKNGSFDVLLATHSPYIVGNRSDLCVELKAEARA
jgi:predicted ATPase